MLTPGRTPPEESVTMPRIVAVVSCDQATPTQRKNHASATQRTDLSVIGHLCMGAFTPRDLRCQSGEARRSTALGPTCGGAHDRVHQGGEAWLGSIPSSLPWDWWSPRLLRLSSP